MEKQRKTLSECDVYIYLNLIPFQFNFTVNQVKSVLYKLLYSYANQWNENYKYKEM